MNNKNNMVVELSIDLLNQISGEIDTLPDLYPYLPLLPQPSVPSPTPDKIFWNTIPFVYPL